MPSPPTLFVTGATGQLGGLVIDALLRTVPASAIVAGVRDPQKPAAVALRDKGVEIRIADYTRPETLENALAGVDRLLLISGSEVGKRKEQHRNVIAAAKKAGVGLIAYTSILHADSSPLLLAEEHRDTEAALADAGVPFVLLRNGWYTEVFTWRLPLALKLGKIMGAAADGAVSSAARADYAEAAAAVLASDDQAGLIHELAGDDAFTLSDLAAIAAEASGVSLRYQNLEPEALKSALVDAGMPEIGAGILADTDAGIAKGALREDGRALSRLIGQPTTPFQSTIAAFARNPEPPAAPSHD